MNACKANAAGQVVLKLKNPWRDGTTTSHSTSRSRRNAASLACSCTRANWRSTTGERRADPAALSLAGRMRRAAGAAVSGPPAAAARPQRGGRRRGVREGHPVGGRDQSGGEAEVTGRTAVDSHHRLLRVNSGSIRSRRAAPPRSRLRCRGRVRRSGCRPRPDAAVGGLRERMAVAGAGRDRDHVARQP